MRARLKNSGRWVAIADRDFAAANKLLEESSDIAAYHLQQATEKYLKAFLSLQGETLKKSHDVSALLLNCIVIDQSFTSLASVGDPAEMTAFATKYRYPNEEEVEFPTADEIASALKLCEYSRALVREKISEFEASLPPSDS